MTTIEKWTANLLAFFIWSFLGLFFIFVGIYFLNLNFQHIHKPLSANTDSSVLVGLKNDTSEAMGSGFVFINGDKVFVWTCAHVVCDAVGMGVKINVVEKTTNTYFSKEKVYVYTKLFNSEKTECGHLTVWADIVRYSWADDLAILELRDNQIFRKSVDFPVEPCYIGKQGTNVFHIGNMGGVHGFRAAVEGIHGINGIILNEKVFDRAALPVQYGSSGGGVFDSWNGQCIGMVAQILDKDTNHQTHFTPYRRMYKFAERLECLWALDKNVSVSSDYQRLFSDDSINITESFVKSIRFPK